MATGTMASASPLQGTLNFSGTAVVSLLGIDFIPPAGGGEGQIFVLPGGNTGDFAVFNAGPPTAGTLNDREESGLPDVGVPINVPGWLDIPGFSFTLTSIRPGGFSSAQCGAPAAAGQTCTPAPFPYDPDGPGGDPPIMLQSPYELTNNSVSSSNAVFFVSGIAIGPGGDMGNFEGQFTATFLDVPFQELLSTVLSGGTVTKPFSAQITVTDIPQVPEPSSMALALGGLALVGAGLARKRRA
jgi:hypothetical protein